MKKVVFILLICFCFIACNQQQHKEISRKSIGKIQNAIFIGGVHNNSASMQIKTEFVIITLEYPISKVPLNVEAYLVLLEDGREYFTWEKHNNYYRI